MSSPAPAARSLPSSTSTRSGSSRCSRRSTGAASPTCRSSSAATASTRPRREPPAPGDPQPRRAVELPARGRASDLLRRGAARPLGAGWRAGAQRRRRAGDRFLQGAPALADRVARLAMPETRVVHRARGPARRGRRHGLPAAGQGQHRRLGRRHRPLSSRRGAARLDRRRHRAAASTRCCWSRNMSRRAAARSSASRRSAASFLYAIEVESGGDSFDLCPADACVAQPGRKAIRMTAVMPPRRDRSRAAERIAQAARPRRRRRRSA